MIRQLTLRAALTLAIAVGLAGSGNSAQADLIQTNAFTFGSVSYNWEVAASLGITMAQTLEWYATENSTQSGDATNVTNSGSFYVAPTAAQSYASAYGTANTGSGIYSSSQSSSATAANYLWLYNSNSFDVLLPIRSYHYNYAYAYSDAHYSGSAYAIAQNFVDVLNYDVGVSYVAETFYAWAGSGGTFGAAGPFITEEEFFYDVRLTPGNNYIVSRVTADTDGFVSVPNPVPEPGTLPLAMIGLVGFAGIAWWRRRVA